MSDQTDDGQNYALMVLAGVVALVIAGVLALAANKGVGKAMVSGLGAGGSAKAAPTAAAVPRGVDDPDGRIDFAPGSDALPAGASETLARVADAAREQAGTLVLVSGFHDAGGDAAAHADLAKKRALAVRHALEANGVAPDRVVLDPPRVATGAADARAARRVEVRLR